MNYQYAMSTFLGVVTARNFQPSLSAEHTFDLPAPMDAKQLAANEAAFKAAGDQALSAQRRGAGEYKVVMQKDFRDKAGNRTQNMEMVSYWSIDLTELEGIRATFDKITYKPPKEAEDD